MFEQDEVEDDPEWLMLPAGRRASAINRLEGLRWYFQDSDRSLKAVVAAAAIAKVSQRTFYELLNRWQESKPPSIWKLVPYAGRRPTGRTKLEPDVAKELARLIEASVANGSRGRDEIVSEVTKAWPVPNLPRPAANTIRRHVETIAKDAVGKFSSGDSLAARLLKVETERHGEVLVIDHVGLNIRGDAEDDHAPLALTLAMDLHTRTIAGFQTMPGAPGPRSLTAALIHAQHSTEHGAGPIIRPRLILDAPRGDEWRVLIEGLARQGVESKVRWSHRLHTGMFSRRIIGTRIGPIALSPRMPKSGETMDPHRHALVSLHQAELLVGQAVAVFNKERLGPDAVMSRIRIN